MGTNFPCHDDSSNKCSRCPSFFVDVPNARVLREEPEIALEPWSFALVIVGSVLTVGTAILILWWLLRRRRDANSAQEPGSDDPDGGGGLVQDDGPNPDDGLASRSSPSKDKMLASVVVDLRMNDSNRRRRGLLRGNDDILLQRASETDVSLTETEGSAAERGDTSGEQFEPTFADLSMEMSDMNQEEDDDNNDIDTLMNSTGIVRRRNVHDMH